MAQSFVDPIGGELTIPGAYPSITVAPANGGLATTGVIVLMGEADSGPAFDEEEDLSENSFAADDIQSIVAKYKSGPVVDAARAASGAAVDPEITNTFSRCIIVKTNKGSKASTSFATEIVGEAFGGRAKSAGSLGNLITRLVETDVAQVYPTTGPFTYIPQPGALQFEIRESGGLATVVNLLADDSPAAAATGLGASGGTARVGCVPNSGVDTLVIAAVGNVVTLTLSNPWVGVAVGDTLEINNAAFAGAGGGNVGWYVVTAVAGAVVTATKLSDKSTTVGHVAGVVVAPAAVGSAAVTYPADLRFYRPVEYLWGASLLDGIVPTLEVAATSALAGDTDPRNACRDLGTATVAEWVSASGAAYVIVGTERKVKITLARKSDSIEEEYIVGGEVGLKLGYDGYNAWVKTTSTGIEYYYRLTNVSTPVTGTITYAQYPTINDVVAFFAQLPNWTASAGTNVLGNLPSTALDVTKWGAVDNAVSCGTTHGGYSGRVKTDAYRLAQTLAASYLLELSSTPHAGLPANAAIAFLAGGTKGATTGQRITDAITSMEQLRANFIIPCFSRNATEDIADQLTDAASTYTIEAINSAVKTHVHRMSGMKTKRNRQAFVSFRGAFNDAADAASNLASHRCLMVFQDVKNAASGDIVQYQPFVGAALAAATQAGGFYKSIVRKQVNITGAIQAAGDWTYNKDSNVENALKAGLNPIKKAEEGGYVWVSDQTTYGKDNKNFYNSAQMVYAGDIVALTTAQRMDRAFVGQSLADVSAPLALSYLDSIMADFLRLKLIAPSSDAPLGYKNAKVLITGGVMRVSVEVKIAGSIYFIPISFYVTEITQSA